MYERWPIPSSHSESYFIVILVDVIKARAMYDREIENKAIFLATMLNTSNRLSSI